MIHDDEWRRRGSGIRGQFVDGGCRRVFGGEVRGWWRGVPSPLSPLPRGEGGNGSWDEKRNLGEDAVHE
jgi:hypothetical protein